MITGSWYGNWGPEREVTCQGHAVLKGGALEALSVLGVFMPWQTEGANSVTGKVLEVPSCMRSLWARAWAISAAIKALNLVSLVHTCFLQIPFPEAGGCNSHAMKFTHFSFYLTTDSCNHHYYLIPEHSNYTKKKHINHHFPCLSQARHPRVPSLPLWIGLSWTFRRNGITCCVAFGVWHLLLRVTLSRHTHTVACVKASFLFTAE